MWPFKKKEPHLFCSICGGTIMWIKLTYMHPKYSVTTGKIVPNISYIRSCSNVLSKHGERHDGWDNNWRYTYWVEDGT